MKKKIVGIIILMLFIGTTLTTIGMANEKQFFQNMNLSINEEYSWPMFCHDLCRNGYSTSSAPNTNNVIWSYDIPGKKEPIDSSPVVDNGRVYIGSHDGNVTCLNVVTGNVLWKQLVGNGVYTASAIVDDRLYVTADPGFVCCLDAINGNILWNYSTNAKYMDSSPAVADGKVYVGAGTNDNCVYCLDAINGSLIWKYQTGNKIYSSPAYYNGKIYIGSYDKNVYCLDAINGSKIWNYTMAGYCFLSSPAYFDGKIYIGSYDKNLYCLDAATGGEIWNFTTGGYVDSSPTIADGKIFFGSYDSYVYCLDAINGSKIWNYKTNGQIYSSPAIADGKLYFGSFDNNFYCLNTITGSVIWNFDAGYDVSSSPAIADGALYIGGVVNGRIYCFRDTDFQPPSAPIITGPNSGKPGDNLEYIFNAVDPNSYQVKYIIDWGDGKTDTTDLNPSGVNVTVLHNWIKKGDYIIKVHAQNQNGLIGPESTKSLTIPRNRAITINSLLIKILDRFPLLERILNFQ